MLRIGLISDTHNFLDPEVLRLFAGVDHILHAGDIGQPRILAELEAVAPVTAVLGNTDGGLACRETESVQLGRLRILLHHIVDPHAWWGSVGERIRRERPQVVVYGHTHRAAWETVDGIHFVNPGSASRPRRTGRPSVAILLDRATGPEVTFHELSG